MIDKLLSLIGIHRVGLVVGVASNVVKAFEQEFAKDQNAKIAAIDTLLQILQSYKDSAVATPVETSTAPATPAK